MSRDPSPKTKEQKQRERTIATMLGKFMDDLRKKFLNPPSAALLSALAEFDELGEKEFLLRYGHRPASVLVNDSETRCMRDQCAATAATEVSAAGGLIQAGRGLRWGAGAPRTKRSG